jgi:hypothetical protein
MARQDNTFDTCDKARGYVGGSEDPAKWAKEQIMFKLMMAMVLGAAFVAAPAFAQDKQDPRDGNREETRQQMIERLRKRLAELEKGEPAKRAEGEAKRPDREEMRKRAEPRREEMRKRVQERRADGPRKGKRMDRRDARPGKREGMRKGMDRRKGKDMRPEKRGKFQKQRGKMERRKMDRRGKAAKRRR